MQQFLGQLNFHTLFSGFIKGGVKSVDYEHVIGNTLL